MIIYPAIDLRGGQVVRLREGKREQQTIFSNDPVTTAQNWVEQGAEWIHVVNLDGAFDEANDNIAKLGQIARLGVPIQFGGGLRSITSIHHAFENGASRVVLGTIAIQKPEVVIEALAQFGADAICIGLDARDGKIATHGWTEITDETPLTFGRLMAQKGVKHALYTDVKRDGSLIGANVHDTINLGRSTGLQVIASGGVSHRDEIHTLAQSKAVAGAIIGMALYEGKLTLKEAVLAAKVN